MIELTLPWPPSVNRYWRSVVVKRRVRVLISSEGRQYRKRVLDEMVYRPKLYGPAVRLAVCIMACPPDRRRRDLDNALKAPLDAMMHAGLYADDSQIDSLTIERGPVVRGGELRVSVQEVME